MQQELPSEDTSVNRTAVEGLDAFFIRSAEHPDLTKALSVKEAAHYYNEPPRRVKRMIREGTIPAARVATEKGSVWRVFSHGAPANVELFVPSEKEAGS